MSEGNTSQRALDRSVVRLVAFAHGLEPVSVSRAEQDVEDLVRAAKAEAGPDREARDNAELAAEQMEESPYSTSVPGTETPTPSSDAVQRTPEFVERLRAASK